MDKVQKTALLACAVLIHCGILLFAQDTDYRFRHLTTEDGLPSNWVFQITQDSRGFIWICSRAGLCRYDGYNIKVYQYDPNDSTSISNDYVKCNLIEDHEGFLWVGTREGLNRFDPKTEKFTRYYHDPSDSNTISSNIINYIYQDRKGTIWIGTSYPGGLNKYIPETNRFTSYHPVSEKDYSSTYIGMYEDSQGIFWVASRDGLLQFDRTREEFILIDSSPKITKKITNDFCNITEDPVGNLWYVGDYIYQVDRENQLLKLFDPLYQSGMIHVNTTKTDIDFEVRDNIPFMWVVNTGRLFRLNINTQELLHVGHDPTDPMTIMASGLRNLYKDASGNLWVGGGRGINVMGHISGQVTIHKDFLAKYNDDALSFLEDSEGFLWVGTHSSGLMQFDKDMNLVKWYKSKSIDPSGDHFDGNIWKIYEDSEQNLWIACNTDGLYYLDREKGKIQRCELKFSRVEMFPREDDHFIYDIFEDSKGVMWVGVKPSLYKRDPDQKSKTTFDLVKSPDPLNYFTITSIFEDHLQGLWFSVFWSGIFYQRKEHRGTDNFIHFRHEANDSHSLSNNAIWSVYEDHENQIWLATSHGLNKFVRESLSFERYFFEQDEGANFIYAVLDDEYGNLWMSTESGLIRISKESLAYSDSVAVKLDHILPFPEIWTYGLHADKQGIIYLGSKSMTGNGYYTINPGDIKENQHIPPVVLTNFSIQNKPTQLDSSIAEIHQLKLSYNENYFSFEFAALDFMDPERNQYAFMLEGLDEEWIYSGNRRFATYTKVPPGDYVFRVKGSNNDGYWNETGASVAITVLPPPWKTWWAYAGYATILIGLIVLWRIYDLRRIRLRQQLELEHVEAHKLKELDTMKSRFFANISHEFRTPLTLILGPLQKLLARHEDEESTREINIAQKNALRLQQLIDQLLTLSRIEAGKLKLQVKEENLVRLVNGYFQSFESLAKQKNIRLEFHADQEEILAYVDHDKMEKVLYNLLSNAFKFTPEGGRVAVTVGGQRSAVISITDTGPGISPAHLPHIFDRFYQADDSDARFQEGTGIGLALAKELVELHHGEIRVESELGKGTAFFVLLPLGSGQLREEGKRGRGEEGLEEFETWNLEHETRNTKLETRNTKHETRNTKHETHSPLLLIVEDNADLRHYIRGFLEDSYSIIECGDGKAGFEKALETIPDLVISDVMMPVMDGYELCTKLKTDERTSHIPVILLTARAAVEDKLQGLETGADDYVAKPFNPEELLARIRNLIQQRKALREKFISDYWKGPHMPGLQIPASGLGMMDKEFLKKAIEVTERHLSDPDFQISVFCREIAMSRQQLYRKLRALMDQAPTEFVRTIRLKKAAELLAQRSGTVSEIAYDTGFNTLSYFTKCFKEQFGVNPSEYPPGNSK
ncbi:MAG: two-component regulator propeller domain-containing protein [Bacteroidales bacterium]